MSESVPRPSHRRLIAAVLVVAVAAVVSTVVLVAPRAGQPYDAVCLTTDPTAFDAGMLACMEERDVERRGFIPLDQQRPTILVDGERRVVTWGPTGDARLTDVPSPSRDAEGS